MEYAIHGLVYLAKMPPDKPVLVSDIASSIGVPEPYLRKVFQQLSRGGVITSQRGARGGVRLARDPARITLKDIVEVMDGALPTYSCLSTLRNCRLSAPCPVHEAFEEARKKMAEVLETVSVKNLLDDISRSRPVAEWLTISA
jgi:Rrf2 family protein